MALPSCGFCKADPME